MLYSELKAYAITVDMEALTNPKIIINQRNLPIRIYSIRVSVVLNL